MRTGFSIANKIEFYSFFQFGLKNSELCKFRLSICHPVLLNITSFLRFIFASLAVCLLSCMIIGLRTIVAIYPGRTFLIAALLFLAVLTTSFSSYFFSNHQYVPLARQHEHKCCSKWKICNRRLTTQNDERKK